MELSCDRGILVQIPQPIHAPLIGNSQIMNSYPHNYNYIRKSAFIIFLIITFSFEINSLTQAQKIGNHDAVYDTTGILKPWTSWRDALDREMKWYAKCPVENGYLRFVYMTFMDGDHNLIERRPDSIPSTQNAVGIISYLKYYKFAGSRDKHFLDVAKSMGDYLLKEAITPNSGKYPSFTRSTGWAMKFPQPEDCGSQADHPYEIQPDKGGLAGYALTVLFEATKDQRYLDQAVQNGRDLVINMREGTSSRSPWPFRADWRTGEGRGDISANMGSILRLFDKLVEHGYPEFGEPRKKLWDWIKTVQIPNIKKDAKLWEQFFEDYDLLGNRNAWSPLNLARYILERKESLDPAWKEDAHDLIDFVVNRFTGFRSGVPICGEQDDDKNPWGGILSTYGAVLAMYTAETGSKEYRALAYQALNYCMYAIDNDGCPGHSSLTPRRGGWQEDSHTDVVHNFIDAMNAIPEWSKR